MRKNQENERKTSSENSSDTGRRKFTPKGGKVFGSEKRFENRKEENKNYGSDKRTGFKKFSDNKDQKTENPRRFGSKTENQDRKFRNNDQKPEYSRRFGSGNENQDRKFTPNNDQKRTFKSRFEEKPTSTNRFEKSDYKGYQKDRNEESRPFRKNDDRKPFERTEFRKSDRFEKKYSEEKPNENRFGERKSFDRFEKSEHQKRTFEKRDFGNKNYDKNRFDDVKSEPRAYRRNTENQDADQNSNTGKRQFKSREGFETKNTERFKESSKDHDWSRQVGLKQKPDYDNLNQNLPPKLKSKVEQEQKRESNLIRLNRYLANAGLCSRREADEMIASGQITVNGQTITEMGYQVKPSDVVKYGRKILNREKLVYLLLNKPKDFVTTTDDPEGRKTVMDLIKNACTERIYPVGRLDRNTTGLLLMTNDGELADKLTHPSNNMKKVYQVELNKPIVQTDFDQILEGLELEDGFIKADDLSVVTPDHYVVGIEIHSGRNRIVRRIFENLGYEVTKLDRTTFAGLTKKDLPRGNWRFLTEKEVIRLKYLI